METKKGNAVAWGKPGRGKTFTGTCIAQVLLPQSAVSQLKDRYTEEELNRLAEAVRKNCNIWYPLKPGDGHYGK